jgi:hypothetical protein
MNSLRRSKRRRSAASSTPSAPSPPLAALPAAAGTDDADSSKKGNHGHTKSTVARQKGRRSPGGKDIPSPQPQDITVMNHPPCVLPLDSTQELIDRIKMLAENWSQEERMYGKNVYYWNIMSNSAMKTVASQVPLTVEELQSIGVLGENIIKEYGERLVKVVSSFVEQKGLGDCVSRRPCKRLKVDSTAGISATSSVAKSATVIELSDDPEDEFDSGIDFTAIKLPDGKA